MTRRDLHNASVAELVDQFATCCIAQYEAELRSDIGKWNKLYWKIDAIAEELKSRSGDQRTELLKLYEHLNIQVRLTAATYTLAIAPVAARQMLESIKDSKEYPYAADASSHLWNLDRGVFKPT
ncbi:MAG: DUF2019 domain-containing protein [Pseudolabrys sp.]